MSLDSVVIVGAGQAGYQVAASLRQEKFTGTITLIGDEPGLPYQRPPLSKAYMLGKIGLANLRFRPAHYYTEHTIDLVEGRVAAIDRTNRRVTLVSGEAIGYGHLVLAMGAHNRMLPVPGAELDGVFGLKTLADADAIAPRLNVAKNVVVVGAGFIGLEFAAVASSLGVAVHVLEVGDRPMARAVSPEMSEAFRAAHAGWGVYLDFRQGLARILGENGRVTGVETTDGRVLAADLVVFGIGVIPNTALAAEAGLDIDNGVKVDANLLTLDPAISAIGDAAAFPSHFVDRHIRLESVQNAMDQARAVAARLCGKPAPYVGLPWFWTDQRDLKLQIAGLHEGYDSTVVLAGEAANQLTVLCFKREQLVAVETLNRTADHMVARKLLARPPQLTPSLASAAGFDFKAFEAAGRI
jgi:3-phenylpropionate/trans-cinnamate dioxygenase ferredoxin reductase subunit